MATAAKLAVMAAAPLRIKFALISSTIKKSPTWDIALGLGVQTSAQGYY
ncbi:MAG: hypothetical protein AAF959_10790 [Cyanobacteria bacterium P01_D01_bin.56]